MKPFFTEADSDMKERFNGYETIEGISLTKANAKFDEWLSKGKVVFGTSPNGANTTQWFTEKQIDKIHGLDWANHTALLVNIEPIEQDSAAKILRDLIEAAESLRQPNPSLSDRARKLLERGGK